MALRIVICCAVMSVAVGFQTFQAAIPNGAIVPNPCTGGSWPGVGHENPNGGGVRNPFGMAFAAEGKVWTLALCQADADGDGRTNGQELGDPDCTWTVGTNPSTSEGITHPGICEDIDSTVCQGLNSWVVGGCSSAVALKAISSTAMILFSLLYLIF